MEIQVKYHYIYLYLQLHIYRITTKPTSTSTSAFIPARSLLLLLLPSLPLSPYIGRLTMTIDYLYFII